MSHIIYLALIETETNGNGKDVKAAITQLLNTESKAVKKEDADN